MAGVTLESLYAGLPDAIGDDAALDAVLRRIGRVADYDGAKLSALRTIVFHNRLVVQAPDGHLVKGELPTPQSFAEAENERIAQSVAEQQRQRELLTPDENYVNPARAETEKFILEVVGARIDALEKQVSDLHQHID
jgi:hypothetical protein